MLVLPADDVDVVGVVPTVVLDMGVEGVDPLVPVLFIGVESVEDAPVPATLVAFADVEGFLVLVVSTTVVLVDSVDSRLVSVVSGNCVLL